MDSAQLKDVFKKFGHFVALAFSLFIVAMTYMFDGNSEYTEKLDKIDDLARKVDGKVKGVPVPPKFEQDQMDRIEKYWGKIDALAAAPDHTNLYPPINITYIEDVAPTRQWINNPQNLDIDVGREKISITWDRPPVSHDEEGKKNVMTKIAGYHILKRWEDKEETIVRYDEDSLSYEDDRVEPRIDYRYKVRAFTLNTDAKFPSGGAKITYEGDEMVVSPYTREVTGKIKPLYRIRLMAVAGSREKNALVEVDKWVQGDWRSTKLWVKKGQMVQKKNVRVPEVDESIDFNPGWKIVRIASRAPYTVTQKVRVPVMDPKTNLPVNPPKFSIQKNKITLRVPAIRYVDDKGKSESVFQVKDEKKGSG